MAAPSVAMSRPSTCAVPDVGGSRPSTILISVDLPAPLAPISPTTPDGTATVSTETAVTERYLLVRASVSIKATATTLRNPAQEAWQRAHQNRLRAPITSVDTGVPQTRHG